MNDTNSFMPYLTGKDFSLKTGFPFSYLFENNTTFIQDKILNTAQTDLIFKFPPGESSHITLAGMSPSVHT